MSWTTQYPKPISRQLEAQWLEDFHRRGDVEARNRVVASCMPFVVKQASRFLRRIGQECDDDLRDDLIQEGALHLVASADWWEAARGVRFLSFAGQHLWSVFHKVMCRNTVIKRPYNLPAGEGLQEKWLACGNTESLPTGCLEHAEGCSALLADSCELDVDRRDEVQFELSQLAPVFAALPERELKILRWRSEGVTLRQIAQWIDLSPERVRQLEIRAYWAVREH